MSRRLKSWIVLSPALICILVAECSAEDTGRRLTIAVLPCYDIVKTFKKFHPLIDHLKQQTRYDIEMIVPTSLAELRAALQGGSIAFTFQDPHTYAMTAAFYNRDALLLTLTSEGTTSQQGLIIARKDAGIRSVFDLKGKTVMFGPRLSITKWVAAKAVFTESGIDIDKDLKTYLHGGCCEDIAFNVYLKAVDAGVVCDHFLGEHSDSQKELGLDIKDIVVVAKTRSTLTRVFAASRQIDGEVVARMEQALLALQRENPEHAKILFPAELGGFRQPSAEEYEEMSELVLD